MTASELVGRHLLIMTTILVISSQCVNKQSLRPNKMLIGKGCSQTGSFRHSSNSAFWSQEYQKYLSYEAHLSFQIV